MPFRAIFYCCLFLYLPLFAEKNFYLWNENETTNEEEVLFLRRIADFWQEGEYEIVKKQMEGFLQTFPSSTFADPLSAAIGDLLLREKNYKAALDYYSKLNSTELIEKTFLNRMQCLYYLEWYATLADECEAQLQKQLDSELALKTTYYLAISLYHQCLNAQKDPQISQKLAQRAEPYFETLLKSGLSHETAQAFAHLCCILKDFPKAADIYLKLTKSEPENEEEMLFQAALIQAEFDKPQALESFRMLSEKKGNRSQEAAYNEMVLLFDTGKHEELLNRKETFLNEIPLDKKKMAYLFLGRSALNLKKYDQAASELKSFIQETPTHELDSLQSSLASLIEASFECNDLKGMDLALTKLSEINPTHRDLAKGRFTRALLLKKLSSLKEAKQELANLLAEIPQFPLRPQALFELAHLEYQARNWEYCHNYSQIFIEECPNSELAPFAWRYLVSSSTALASEKQEKRELKESAIYDLKNLLKQENMFSEPEKNHWQFVLSKAYFDLGYFEEAIFYLSYLIKEESYFSQQPNAYLLLALCYREAKEDLLSFCSLAETAIEKKADLMELGSLHIALFNAYLSRANQEPNLLEMAAKHLYHAFEQKVPINEENLVWLSAYYDEQLEKDSTHILLAEKSASIYSYLLNHLDSSKTRGEDSILYKLAKLYSVMEKTEEQIALLHQLLDNHPNSEYKIEAQFLLAEGYAAIGNKTTATALYDLVSQTAPPLRSPVSAKAHLQGARLHLSNILEKKLPLDHPETIQTLSTLKDLILQKTLLNEPIHLEAALEYVHLKEILDPQSMGKKTSLLKKLKADFESDEDLLSKDYHLAKEKFPEKEKIYRGYITLLDAEIFLSIAQSSANISEQKELQAKGKDLLLEIIKEKAHPALVSRATSRLQATDADLTKN